ncbi:uncharacterized protein [Narcine bancroftii]|uniref:uncharacterized protein n=1 Tax=Narcine bancroftii TaxID=1343680 RepID=UPI0038311927
MVEEPTASGSEPGGAEGEGARGRIGDLVLAAELMEMVNETVQHVQKEAHFEEAFGHDHGAYVLPDDPAILTKMVKEMQETVHAQSWRLSVLQHELASTLALYKELKERYEKERSTLSLELTSQVSELCLSQLWRSTPQLFPPPVSVFFSCEESRMRGCALLLGSSSHFCCPELGTSTDLLERASLSAAGLLGQVKVESIPHCCTNALGVSLKQLLTTTT